MRVFVAGGTGVLGRRLVPQLVARGHGVTATTTAPGKLGLLKQLGADGVVMDGLDATSVREAVAAGRPDVIVHQMTGISPAHAGKPVILTAKVPSGATGSVQFLDGTTVIGTATVAGGTATTTIPEFTNGTHNLTASYGGDSNYSAAVSAVLALNVTKSGSSVTLAS